MMKVEIDAAELQAQFNAAVLQTAFGKVIQDSVNEKIKQWNEGSYYESALKKHIHSMMDDEVRKAVQAAVAPKIAEIVKGHLTDELIQKVVAHGVSGIEFKRHAERY